MGENTSFDHSGGMFLSRSTREVCEEDGEDESAWVTQCEPSPKSNERGGK